MRAIGIASQSESEVKLKAMLQICVKKLGTHTQLTQVVSVSVEGA